MPICSVPGFAEPPGGVMQRALLVIECLLVAVGIVLCAVYGTFRIHGSLHRGADLERFHQAAAQGNLPGAEIDTSLWSQSRIEAYRRSLQSDLGLPLAVLEIPAIDLEVPVLEGTDELTLNRAVGHIDGTAWPGQGGNVAIAGHRDGFFRGLKDLDIGDRLFLRMIEGRQDFKVQDLRIVDPKDVYVLDPTPNPTLTLVTCYPFYFVGKAPQRFIVTAVDAHGEAETPDTDGAGAISEKTLSPQMNNSQTISPAVPVGPITTGFKNAEKEKENA
jgi:sortase A